MDISALRKSRSNDFSKILGEFDKISNPSSEGTKSYEDDRFWQPEVDKAGNGYAVIRFLPRVEGDEFPWVRVFSHGFQGPTGKWYIENSLTTLGENDPVGELNSKLWNSGSEANKEIARKQKRRLTYIANVLIINDPAHPELNGQVKLFKFGKKIFDKIMDKARPTFEDEKPVLVFDLWEGCNFKLKIRKVDGYRNYDKSEFESTTALFDGEEDKLLELVGRQYKLSEFTDRKNFKTYEELARRLNAVLNPDGAGTATAASMVEEEEEVAPAPTLKAVSSRPAPSKPAPSLDEDDEDDAMSYFQKLANDN